MKLFRYPHFTIDWFVCSYKYTFEYNVMLQWIRNPLTLSKDFDVANWKTESASILFDFEIEIIIRLELIHAVSIIIVVVYTT